jgi:hypothetical protein
MEIVRIQPNCSECSLVVYPDKLNKKQKEFIDKFIKDEKLRSKITSKGNISIETGGIWNPQNEKMLDDGQTNLSDKTDLWALRDKIETLSKHLKLFIYEDNQYRLIRDDSYYDMLDEGHI